MYNIAIIGAGGLGSRHLQAVAQMDRPINIQVVDVSSESLQNARRLFEQVPHENVNGIEFITELETLPSELDVVVVATSSAPRAEIVEFLLTTKKVNNLILEKVLFPRLEEYTATEELINMCGCNVWVNCVYRMWPSYNQVKDLFAGQRIYYSISGSNWGLACNAIHYLDIIANITGSSEDFIYDTSKLDIGYIPSKRSDYIEFTGALTGSSPQCPYFSLTSSKDGEVPPVSEIIGENARISIYEGARKAYISRKESNWIPEEINFDTPYQSQLTGKLISEILDTGTCSLPTYQESAKLHIPMLKAFMSHLSKETGKEVQECLIT